LTRHPLPCPLHARALTGDRARARGAEKRADAPIHLIKRSQELKAGKYALFTYSLSPFIFFVQKKKKLEQKFRRAHFLNNSLHNLFVRARALGGVGVGGGRGGRGGGSAAPAIKSRPPSFLSHRARIFWNKKKCVVLNSRRRRRRRRRRPFSC
jgi:hypothetical protein